MAQRTSHEADELVSLRDSREFFPKRGGKLVSIPTIRRWHAKGVRGAKLQLERVGGMMFVRLSEIDRFVAACNGREVDSAAQQPIPQTPRAVTGAQKRRRAKVHRMLAAMGVYGAAKKEEVLGVRQNRRHPRRVSRVLPSGALRDQQGDDDGRGASGGGAAAAGSLDSEK